MARPAAKDKARPSAPEDRAVRILLVDDLLPFIELQKNYLKRTTCRILTARTGAQALKVCRMDRPDLIVLDEAMPGMDGIEACRHLKADPMAGRIPIVVVTGQAGCDGVLIKPFDGPAFLEMVRRFVPLLERNEGRIPVSCRVEFTAPSGSYTAYTRDVSLHGLFLKSPRPFAIGARLRLTLHLPMRAQAEGPRTTTSLSLEGEVRRVVRASPGEHLLPGVGVRFLGMSPEAQAQIEAFIASRR
jgi:two-component system alkaline phosphatase synthesis response regulator PhoP